LRKSHAQKQRVKACFVNTFSRNRLESDGAGLQALEKQKGQASPTFHSVSASVPVHPWSRSKIGLVSQHGANALVVAHVFGDIIAWLG
jgi:hypothetical protein